MRNKVLLIGLVCAAPFVLGTLAYYFKWDVGSSSNYGELLAPRPLAGPPFEKLRGKWVLIMADASRCDAWCEKKIYYLHQLWRAQGKDMNRVERLWLLTDEAKPRAELSPAIDGMRVERAPGLDVFPGAPADHVYLVDPLGNLMLRWPREADPSRMLKDLQRLLKVAPRTA